jgi:hypothetical protein
MRDRPSTAASNFPEIVPAPCENRVLAKAFPAAAVQSDLGGRPVKKMTHQPRLAGAFHLGMPDVHLRHMPYQLQHAIERQAGIPDFGRNRPQGGFPSGLERRIGQRQSDWPVKAYPAAFHILDRILAIGLHATSVM